MGPSLSHHESIASGLGRIVGILQAFVRGLERSRQRRALSALSDAMLHDLGLTREEVAREADKPFWR
jgi:uncharacterized protein YjiS (DUF1127 family)